MYANINRKRPIQVKFFVDENELAAIKKRMAQFGTDNLSTNLRTMVMEGIFPTAEGEESSPVANTSRKSISAMTSLALSPWMSC